MSIEAQVEEMWGDSKDEAWKAEEVKRLKAEQGITEVEEPGMNMAAPVASWSTRKEVGQMKVKVMNHLYQMNQKEYQGLLQTASEQVPFGIYAIEKQGYAELRCDKCTSVTQLKNLTRQFKAQGFKVYANGR